MQDLASTILYTKTFKGVLWKFWLNLFFCVAQSCNKNLEKNVCPSPLSHCNFPFFLSSSQFQIILLFYCPQIGICFHMCYCDRVSMPSEAELPERCVKAKNYSTLTHPLFCFKVIPEMAQQVFLTVFPSHLFHMLHVLKSIVCHGM